MRIYKTRAEFTALNNTNIFPGTVCTITDEATNPMYVYQGGEWNGVVSATTNPVTGGIELTSSGTTILAINDIGRKEKSIMFLGDSHSAQGFEGHVPIAPDRTALNFSAGATYANISPGGNYLVASYASGNNPLGAGTVKFYISDTTMTWTPYGESEGARVSVANGGWIALPGGTDLTHVLYVVITNMSAAPTADKSDTITLAGGASAPYMAQNANGLTSMACFLAGNNFSDFYNFGIGGSSASNCWLQRDQWQGIKTDLTHILITNGITDIATADTQFAAIKEIMQSRMAIGSKVICSTIPPKTGMTTTEASARQYFNSKLIAYCTQFGAEISDLNRFLASSSSALMPFANTANTSDGTHLITQGAYTGVKNTLAEILKKHLATYVHPHAGVVYNETSAPNGNLITKGIFAGTGGYVQTAAGVTGTVGDGWYCLSSETVVDAAHLAVVCKSPADGSPVARTDGYPGNWQNIVMTAGASTVAGTNVKIYTDYLTQANFAAGDQVFMEYEIEITITGSGLRVFSLGMLGATVINTPSSRSWKTMNGDTIKLSGKSFPWKISSYTNLAQVRPNFYFEVEAGASVVTVNIGHIALRKVIAP